MRKSLLTTIIASSLLALSACGTTQGNRPQSNPATEVPEPSVTPAVIPQAQAAPAVKPANAVTQSLRQDATAALDQGDTTKATRLLERALRIDAREASTYLLFARLRKTEGDLNAALQLIDKGLSLGASASTARALRQLRESIVSIDINS